MRGSVARVASSRANAAAAATTRATSRPSAAPNGVAPSRAADSTRRSNASATRLISDGNSVGEFRGGRLCSGSNSVFGFRLDPRAIVSGVSRAPSPSATFRNDARSLPRTPSASIASSIVADSIVVSAARAMAAAAGTDSVQNHPSGRPQLAHAARRRRSATASANSNPGFELAREEERIESHVSSTSPHRRDASRRVSTLSPRPKAAFFGCVNRASASNAARSVAGECGPRSRPARASDDFKDANVAPVIGAFEPISAATPSVSTTVRGSMCRDLTASSSAIARRRSSRMDAVASPPNASRHAKASRNADPGARGRFHGGLDATVASIRASVASLARDAKARFSRFSRDASSSSARRIAAQNASNCA